MSRDFCKLLMSAVFAFASTAQAGTIIASGDSNISDDLAGKSGNARFFSNILGSGTSVAVLDTTPTLCCLGPFDDIISNYYNSLTGVTSAKIAGPVSAASLAGVNVFVAVAPTQAFTGAETLALTNFLSGGGTIFLLGDNSSFPGENANINNLLIALGSGLQIVEDIIDAGFNPASILADPLTTGIASFEYAATSRVTGGTGLFQTMTGSQTFVAYESSNGQVPEPGAWLLTACGLFALGLRRSPKLLLRSVHQRQPQQDHR